VWLNARPDDTEDYAAALELSHQPSQEHNSAREASARAWRFTGQCAAAATTSQSGSRSGATTGRNPGDAPLPPITDPDVIEPGEPNPAHPPMRVRGVKRSPEGSTASSSALEAGEESRNVGSNLFSSSELEHAVMAANLADP
jgi:hypothetical protein